MATKTKTLRTYKTMPKGYKKETTSITTAPRGTVLISNGKSFFGGQRKSAYLIVDEKAYNERKKAKAAAAKSTTKTATKSSLRAKTGTVTKSSSGVKTKTTRAAAKPSSRAKATTKKTVVKRGRK